MCVKFFSGLWSVGLQLLVLALLSSGVASCATAAHAFRINPEEEIEQYRITCKKRFYYCELEAEAQCDGEYTELNRLSNLPELPLVKNADVSSTGPGVGVQYWQGELTIQCGREVPNLPLVRAGATTAAPMPAAANAERVCVPGATQACLGPGACSGAQACLSEGQGFGPCDCGPVAAPATSPGAPPVPALAPPATSSAPLASPTPPAASAPVPSSH